MPKFPVDAPKQRGIKSLEILGFRVIREKEHISEKEDELELDHGDA
jgi:hypothetical protein